MDPISAGIAGVSSLLGNVFSSSQNAKNTQDQLMMQQAMQAQTENFNASQTYQQDQFQQYNSNTAYQRAVSDMKNAGLNPMMMFGSGGPASTPSGSAASVGTPNVPMPTRTSPMAGLGQAVSSAMTTAVQSKEMDKISEITANLNLENQDLRRQLNAGRPEKGVELTDAQIAALTSQVSVNDQRMMINKFDEVAGRTFWSLPHEVQVGLIVGQKGLDAAGQIVDMAPGVRSLKGMIGGSPTVGGTSAMSPVTKPIMQDEASRVRNSLWTSSAGQRAREAPEAYTPSERRLQMKEAGLDKFQTYEQMRTKTFGPGAWQNF